MSLGADLLAACFAAGLGRWFGWGVVGAGSAASALGRPVLIDGTACKALRNALSDRPAGTFLSPARSSSLFLTGWGQCCGAVFQGVEYRVLSSLG